MAWWREARFGMFIHFGLFAIPAGEWKGKPVEGVGEWIMHDAKIPVSEYEQLQKQFNPVNFNAGQWARIAKNAGMKYVVLTTKHLEGFCLFTSKLTDYNIMNTPFKRDLLKELATAVRAEGLTMCTYYCIEDCHHPDWLPRGPDSFNSWDTRPTQGADFNRYLDYMSGQMRELLTHYGRIGVLWFDAPYEHPAEAFHGAELVRMMRRLQPGLIVNDRLGIPQDFDTPEQTIPATGIPGRDWETCMTMNDTWGFKKNDHNWKSTETLLRNLIDIVSKGGNYLLNVGPTAYGEIPSDSVQRLEEIGRWLAVNGEAIYGTTASPFPRLAWGRCTQKPGRLYLHVFDWPAEQLVVPGLKSKVVKACLLSDPEQKALAISQNEEGVTIKLPDHAPDRIASVVELSIEGAAEVTPCVITQAADGSAKFLAIDATVHGRTAAYETDLGKDCIGYWTDPQDFVSWDYAVKKPGSFEVEISYACDDPSAGSEYVVEIGGQKLQGKVEGTGGWDKFVTKDLGEIRLDAAGRQLLSVRAAAMPHGAVMNLRSVLLKPLLDKGRD